MNKLRQFLAASVFLGIFGFSMMAAAADAFFLELEDLPIMTGLVENQAASMTFETANGRIVEVEASGAVAADAVRGFYAETLPQLGWVRVADGIFERDRERLQLDISDVGGGRVLVAFSLSPKPN